MSQQRSPKGKCSISGCSSEAHVRKMCIKHYGRVLKHGDPHFLVNRRIDPDKKFFSMVDKDGPGGCWIWTGTRSKGRKNRDGYARIRVNGRITNGHRWAYERFIGAVPKGKVVMHKCDVSYCVNPAHLQVGTSAENHADMIRKGRAFWQKARM